MTHAEFRQLPPAERTQLVLSQGTYLLCRGQPSSDFYLYHLANQGTGIFVELYYEPTMSCLLLVRSFTSLAVLEEYVHYVHLPAL